MPSPGLLLHDVSVAVAITVTSVDEDTEQVLFDIEVAETAS